VRPQRKIGGIDRPFHTVLPIGDHGAKSYVSLFGRANRQAQPKVDRRMLKKEGSPGIAG